MSKKLYFKSKIELGEQTNVYGKGTLYFRQADGDVGEL
jgi:hypothetical protein